MYLHDFNCGLKAYKKQVVKSIDVYGDMHRYIPVLAANAGFKRITEKEVKHQARPYGSSKFGTERFYPWLFGFGYTFGLSAVLAGARCIFLERSVL